MINTPDNPLGRNLFEYHLDLLGNGGIIARSTHGSCSIGRAKTHVINREKPFADISPLLS